MQKSKRIESVDFIKCVCIILMVIFHLAYFTDQYPLAKQFVYTFHMPIFLFISGFFLNTSKSAKDFLHSSMRILIPYIIMEVLYVIAASFLPTRDAVDNLSPALVLDKLFIHPLGPYWYLHTILIASTICFGTSKLLTKIGDRLQKNFSKYEPFLAALLLVAFSIGTGLIDMANVFYYALGFIVASANIEFERFVRPSLVISLIGVLLIALAQEGALPSKQRMSGQFIVYGMMSFMMGLYNVLPQCIKKWSLRIGRSTLSILLFSPIFTMASKLMIPYLEFDSSRILYMVLATIISISGSMFIAKMLELLTRGKYHS